MNERILFLKAHVAGYTRRDGTYVKPHDRKDGAAATPEQRALFLAHSKTEHPTETPAFRKWFGYSRVVDAKGRPLVVYHATYADFGSFRTEGNDRQGFVLDGAFFAETEAAAREHGGDRRMVAAYLSIKNPRIAVMSDDTEAINAWRNPMSEQDEILAARKAGNDGVVFSNEETGERYFVAFRPEQIKSATGNSGDFDPSNPDITKAIR